MYSSVTGSNSGASVLVSVEYHSPAGAAVHSSLRRLRPGCTLQYAKGVYGTVMGLPTALQADRSLYFAPAAADAQMVCTAHSPARAYLLWPALQATPDWLHAAWIPVRGAEVKVRWGGFSLKERAWLNITNQRWAYEEQPLLLYTLASSSGVLPAGKQLVLPRFASFCTDTYTPRGLHFPPAVVLCSVKGSANKPSPGAAAPTSAAVADGPRESPWDGLELLECVCVCRDLASCTLEEICLLLEEGHLDTTNMGRAAADALLHRSMAAGDDELLLMLVQADVCLRCSHSVQQLLLTYACQRDLLPLAEHVLGCTTVEMTQPELAWLVGSLVASNNMYEAERLLTDYVLTRRNALSSTAAIEYALIKAATASFVPNQDAMQLAMRFRAAKHALLRQLMKRYSDEQKSSARAACGTSSTVASTIGSDSMSISQLSHLAGGSRYIKQGVAPLMLLDPLLHTVKLCLQELSTSVIGRGTGVGRLSIHDSSPYQLALSLQDSDFLGMQPVQDYTRLIWNGLELHRMRRVTWQALASTEDAASANGPFSSVQQQQLAAAAATDSSQVSYRVTAEVAELTPIRPFMSHTGAPLQETLAGSTTTCRLGPGPCAEGLEGPGVIFDRNVIAPAVVKPDGSWVLATSSSNASTSSGNSPTGKAAGWTIKARRRTTHGNRTVAAGGSTATRRAADSGFAAAAAADSSWMDTHVVFHLLENLGLAGGFAARLALLGAILLHGVLLAPRALHNSSWGRFVKRMVFEVFFLVVFQMTVMAQWQDSGKEWECQKLLLFAMPPLLLGNILDIVYQLKFKWDGNILAYLADHWSKLDVLVNFGLLGTVFWQWWCMLGGTPPHDVFNLELYNIHVVSIVQSAFAVLVWSRALGLLTPLSSKLGAMLYILRRGAEEAGVLVPVVIVLMLGFGTTLTVAYGTTEPKYNTLAAAMRVLVTPADLRLTEFDGSGKGNPFMVVWGQTVLILYIVLVNILIMSLVIAVITNAYNPEMVKAQAIVMQAETTFQYDFHVRHALPCSPVNLLQQLCAWLPLGYRSRVLPRACLKWWLIPIDGYVPEPIAAHPAMLLVTGPSEVGYLAFMFLMYPLFAVTGLVLLAAYMPFSVLHFAIKGHEVWLESAWSGDSSTATSTEKAQVARRGSLDVSAWGGSSLRGSPAPRAPRTSASLEIFRLDPASRQGSGVPPANTATGKPVSMPGEVRSAGLAPAAGPAVQQRRSVLSNVPGQYSGRVAGQQQRGVLYGLKRLLLRCVTTVAAAAVGTVAYAVLLVVLVLALLWAWVTRTVFSVYCIFWPCAADTPCCFEAQS